MQMKRWRQLMTGVVLAAWTLTASALNFGDKAPEFAAPSSTGKEIKLADFAGKKHTVLFFYIGAFTNT
jgi:peroxiredoxin